MNKEFKIEYNHNGTKLDAAELSLIAEYYDAACTGNLIFDNYLVSPDLALQLGYEARTIMEDGVDEWDAIDDVVRKYGLICCDIVNNDLITDFFCEDKLEQYTDSMLFDSNTTIATLHAGNDNYKITIELMTRGFVRVEYRGDIYTEPSAFPEELRLYIKDHPGTWSVEAPDGDDPMGEKRSIYVADSNWFEYIYNIDVLSTGEHWSDGIMFDNDLSQYTPESLCEEMANDILPQIMENLG